MSYLNKRIALLRVPVFRWYLLSCVLATTGGGLTYISLIWLVLRDQNNVGAVAVTMLCFWLPGVILGPLMGVIVDRIKSRNLLLIFSNWTRAIVLLGFGTAFYWHQNIIEIYLLALVLGLFFTIYMPAAFRLTREITTPDQLLYANATIDMVFEIGNMVGMGLAGILIALVKPGGTLIINGILFVIAGAALFLVKPNKADESQPAPIRIIEDFRSGLRYIFSHRSILLLYTIQLFVFIEYLTAPVLLAPYARNVLHTNAAQFGYIEMMLSIGAIVGGVFFAWLSDLFGLFKCVIIATIVLMACYYLFSHNHIIWRAEVLYFVIGVTFAMWPLIITRAQESTALDYQGRVQSCFNSLSGLMMILIYLAVKLGSQYISIQLLYYVEISFTVITLILLIYSVKKLN